MKLMIAADLHGSLGACERLLQHFSSSGAEQLLLLGDLLNHGPRNPVPADYAPAAVAERLNQCAQKILAIQGNCDSEVDQMLLSFPLLGRYSLVLGSFGGRLRRLFLTHGHHYGPDQRPPLAAGDLLACGHTHIPQLEYRDACWLLNPGSTTFPKGGSEAGFALLDDDQLGLYRLVDGVAFAQLAWD